MEIIMGIIVATGEITLGCLIGYGLMVLFNRIKRWYYEYLYSRSLWCVWYGDNIYDVYNKIINK